MDARFYRRLATTALGAALLAPGALSAETIRQWQFAPNGETSQLALREVEARQPAANEVAVRVHAVSLNRRDLMMVAGQCGRGGTKPNVIAEEAYAEVDLRVPTMSDSDELTAKILNLKSRTDGVTVKVIGELNRPPYEKGNAGAALYEHARTIAAEIGFDLVDTATGGGSDGNFTAPHTATLDGLGVDGQGAHTHYEQMYISSIEPRTRLLYRLYQTLR